MCRGLPVTYIGCYAHVASRIFEAHVYTRLDLLEEHGRIWILGASHTLDPLAWWNHGLAKLLDTPAPIP
jgi:hypothetical protein